MSNLEIVNKINWNGLNCFDRSLCLSSLAFQKNALFVFLLLKIQYRDFFNNAEKYSIAQDSYYHTLLNFLNLDFERIAIDSDSLIDRVRDDLNSGYKIVLNTDTFNIKETKDYQKKNHPHYTLISEIKEKTIVVIDEDWSKNYWKKTNAQNGVIYIEKEYSFNEIIEQCFSHFNPNEISYLRIFPIKNKVVSLEDVLKEFSLGVKSILGSSEYFDKPIKALKNFYETFDKNVIKSNNNKELTEFEMKNKYIYPGVLDIIGCHHFSIDSQAQALITLKNEKYIDTNTSEQYMKVLEKYELIKLFIAKDLFDSSPKHKNILFNLIKDVLDEEYRLYFMLYDCLTKFSNKK